jgi:hypothetical protein
MKTIKKQEEIAFNAISFKDAIILLPLMDEIVKAINQNRIVDFYNNLPKEEREKYRHFWRTNKFDIMNESLEQILHLLQNLGFESQYELKTPSTEDLELKPEN